jgi:pimeloyl-ACP methyl ester carboxylesterase
VTVGVRGLSLEGPWRHRDIAANGIRFHVAVGESFTPGKDLILLLHGFGEFWWAWRHQIPALDAAGFSVAAMDLRGYGASDKTPHGYDAHTTAYDVTGVIKSLGFSSAVVVGHDWGGMAAWATLAYAAGPVRALVSVAAPHPLAFPWRANLPQLALAQLPVLAERRIRADDGAFVERLLRERAVDGAGLMTAAEAGHYRNALRQWPSPQCALEYQRTFVRSQIRASGWEYRRALRQPVRAPLLSIHGQADRLVPLAAMTAADRWLKAPHRVVDLPGVGHLPHEEAPGVVTRAILDWLQTSATSS